MTDQELSNRLRKLHLAVDCRIAADRIEELMGERDEALNQLDSARHSVDVLEKRLIDKMAELARAVDIIKQIIATEHADDYYKTMAEEMGLWE